MQEGYRYNYGKRSADAEADADAWYRPYSNWGNNWPMMSGNNWPMMSYNNWNMMMNKPGMQVTDFLVSVWISPLTEHLQEGYRYNYGKRSADADAGAWYGPYSYSNNWGYNGNNWNMMGNWNMMNNWNNRPYNMWRGRY